MRSFEHITDAIKRYLHNQQGTEQQGNRRTLINATSHSSGNTFQAKKKKRGNVQLKHFLPALGYAFENRSRGLCRQPMRQFKEYYSRSNSCDGEFLNRRREIQVGHNGRRMRPGPWRRTGGLLRTSVDSPNRPVVLCEKIWNVVLLKGASCSSYPTRVFASSV